MSLPTLSQARRILWVTESGGNCVRAISVDASSQRRARRRMPLVTLRALAMRSRVCVRDNGDAAVTKYAQKFDGSTRTQHRMSQEEIDAAIALTPPQVQSDIKEAQANIRRFALAQRATMTDLT